MKIIEGTYTYYSESPQEELDLKNSFLEGETIFSEVELDTKENRLKMTDKVLAMPVDKQIHLLHSILDTMYLFDDNNIQSKNVEKFLAQKVFNKLRDAIYVIVDDDLTKEEQKDKISLFENELGIKIIDSKE